LPDIRLESVDTDIIKGMSYQNLKKLIR